MRTRGLDAGLKRLSADLGGFCRLWLHALQRTARADVASLFLRGEEGEHLEHMESLLAFVIAHLDRPEELIPVVRGIGARHAAQGIRAAHYAAIGEVFLLSLESWVGEEWSDNQAACWRGLFAQISAELLAAQRQLACAC